jgi:hypothetical protein
MLQLDSKEHVDMNEYAEGGRESIGATDDQDVMIACAWVLPDARRRLKAFPEVLGIDGTHETNDEDRPHITISARDSNGKMFIVVRIFVPNERAWLFRWVFQEALPKLLGEAVLSKVKVVITDGDSQEISQLEAAMKTFFLQAIRVRCGWHIIDRGWIANVGKCLGLGRKLRAEEKETMKIIKHWLFSFMKRGLESKEQYEM